MNLLNTEILNYAILSSFAKQKAPGSPHPIATALEQEETLSRLGEAAILLNEMDWHWTGIRV